MGLLDRWWREVSVLPWVGPVCNCSMADRGDADRPVAVGELVDDAIRPDSQRAKTSEPAPQLVSGSRLAFKETERVFNGVDQRPAEVKQFQAGAARKDDPGHASADCATLGEFRAQRRERHRLVAGQLS